MSGIDNVLLRIDNSKDEYISLLKEWVSVKSVSGDPSCRPKVREVVGRVAERLKSIGATNVRIVDTGMQTLPSGEKIEYPPAVFAELIHDPKKPTVAIYGHLDVMPAEKTDGWDSDPWTLEERDGNLYGRGATDDKGPIVAWFSAIESYTRSGIALPVNLKFVFEGYEELGSGGFTETFLAMKERNDPWFENIDFCVISDTYWLADGQPCMQWGLRGICRYHLIIEGPASDLHSGAHGGTLAEPMSDLCYVLGRLTDANHNILIPGVQDEVRPYSPEEKALYEKIDLSMEERMKHVGCPKFTTEDKTDLMARMWRFPTCSVHGIQGAFSDVGDKTVIPAKVIGKFSVRTVPDMTPEGTDKRVADYVNKLWQGRGSPNKMEIKSAGSGPWWVEDPKGKNYKAGSDAYVAIYQKEPFMIRSGGSIPIAVTIASCTGASVCLLPIGLDEDRPHGLNEKIGVKNLFGGAKVMATYLSNLARE